MSRSLISNGAKLILLLGALFGPTQAVRTVCLIGLVAVFVSDVLAYRRERDQQQDPDDDPRHVPLPPAWQRQRGDQS